MSIITKTNINGSAEKKITKTFTSADLAKASSIHKKFRKSNKMSKYNKIIFEYISPEKNPKVSCSYQFQNVKTSKLN
jgi:hypothetical protein